VAEPRTRASQVVRRELGDFCLGRTLFHHCPDDLFGDSSSPNRSALVYATEDSATRDSCRGCPVIHVCFDPVRNGNRSNMSALSDQIDNGPVVFPPLKMLRRKVGQLGSAQPTGQAEREDRSTPLAPDRSHVRSIEQGPGFLGGQPVPEADAQLPGSLDATNAGGRL
jgi:hypothetical protein